MTKKKAFPLVVGAEIDELVAVGVMGWKPFGAKSSATWVHPEGWHTSRGAWQSFSLHMDAAMTVAEKIRRDSGFSVYWQFIDCGEYGWRVDLCESLEGDKDATLLSIPAATLPLAICIAAAKYSAKHNAKPDNPSAPSVGATPK
jgi:hypothetical protein